MAEEKEIKKKDKILSVGFDCGTMFIVCGRSDTNEIKLMRNVFLPIEEDEISISDLTDISFVKSDDGKVYIIGNDAFRFANMFGKQVSRPMKSGLISPDEIDAIDVLTLMVKSLIGEVKEKEVYCSYSIPAEAIDVGKSVIYHQKVFGRIFSSLGINNTSINEAMAIIYSECAKEKFTGIGISFGAGMCNVCMAAKGVEILKFSTARSGDWIDNSVAESLNLVPNRVAALKEKNFKFDSFQSHPDKKTKRILESIEYYYTSLIEYTIKKIVTEFNNKVNVELDEKIPIVISGGTSLPEGFIEFFKTCLDKYNLPFEVSEIRRAKNPLTAVAEGLLIKTISDVSKLK